MLKVVQFNQQNNKTSPPTLLALLMVTITTTATKKIRRSVLMSFFSFFSSDNYKYAERLHKTTLARSTVFPSCKKKIYFTHLQASIMKSIFDLPVCILLNAK